MNATSHKPISSNTSRRGAIFAASTDVAAVGAQSLRAIQTIGSLASRIVFLSTTSFLLGGCSQRSDPLICDTIQSAYTAASNSAIVIYPDRVVPFSDNGVLHYDFSQSYAKTLGIQWDDLKKLDYNRARLESRGFLPNCKWKGTRRPILNYGGPWFVAFSKPVFDKEKTFAIVELSFHGQWNYGEWCSVRKATTWSAVCTINYVRPPSKR